MRYFKFVFLVTIFLLSPLFSNAQRSDRNFPESVILNAKFSRDLVWDVQRFPITPKEGREWKLSGLKSPYDVDSKSRINWGRSNDRYLMFDIEEDRSDFSGSLYDERTGKKFSISLNLYDSDGRFVKRVSRWGNLMGFGSAGFMYEQEGRFGTFFSVTPQREGDVIIYRPELIKVSYLSEIMNAPRDSRRGQNRRDAYRNNENSRGDVQEFNDLKLTFKAFREEGSRDLKEAIRREYRGECEVADWNDLKSVRNIERWISGMRLKRGQTFMVTKNGRYTYGDDRQYFVLYSPYGELPTGFLTHDKIANKLFLGSWYGEPRQVLIKDRP